MIQERLPQKLIQERLNDFAAISSTYRIKTTSKVDNIRCALPVTSITQIFARLNQLLAVCHHSNMSPRVTRSMKRLQNEKKKVTKKVTTKKKSKKNIQVESDDFLVEEGSISSRLSVEYEEDKPEESLSSASNCHPTFRGDYLMVLAPNPTSERVTPRTCPLLRRSTRMWTWMITMTSMMAPRTWMITMTSMTAPRRSAAHRMRMGTMLPCSLAETYTMRRESHLASLHKRMEEMRQKLVLRVKAKESEAKEAWRMTAMMLTRVPPLQPRKRS